jgi:hypothetical protein
MSGPLPPVLYKYLPLEYARMMLDEGALMFSTLAWFQNLEDEQRQRGDPREGSREYAPARGLRVTRTRHNPDGTASIDTFTMPKAYRATSARRDNIFIYSTALRPGLSIADEGTNGCVEIYDPAKFLARLRGTLRRLPRAKVPTLIYDSVRYYSTEDPPDTEHELPDRVVMRKHEWFREQHEYRFAFGTRIDAFDFGRMTHALAEHGQADEHQRLDPAKHRWLIRMGLLVDCCRIA